MNSPYPFIFNRTSVVLPGIITFLFIALIAPFGFSSLPVSYRILFALVIGVICSLSGWAVVSILRRLFPQYTHEDHWTVGKEIILFISVVLVICLLIFLTIISFNLTDESYFHLFKKVVIITSSISVFPIVIQVLFEQYRYQKQSAEQAIALTQELKRHGQPNDEVLKSFRFETENGKVELQLALDQILYIKAEGNYVEVFYLNQDKVEKKIIRNRLGFFARQLPERTFFHCHKSYLVNGKHVLNVEGNARNFELILHKNKSRIPVSRSKSEDLSKFLKSL